MKKEEIYLLHILQCIEKIEAYTITLNEDAFLANPMVQDAVIRNFEVIGEATKNLSKEFRQKHAEIEWRKIAGLRDKLIHDYIGVDLWAVWALVEKIIPQFKKQVQEIMNKEGSN
ncbi:MAG: HepT-like ribonuclease domain-containing protein [Bacteroidota bacterium]